MIYSCLSSDGCRPGLAGRRPQAGKRQTNRAAGRLVSSSTMLHGRLRFVGGRASLRLHQTSIRPSSCCSRGFAMTHGTSLSASPSRLAPIPDAWDAIFSSTKCLGRAPVRLSSHRHRLTQHLGPRPCILQRTGLLPLFLFRVCAASSSLLCPFPLRSALNLAHLSVGCACSCHAAMHVVPGCVLYYF